MSPTTTRNAADFSIQMETTRSHARKVASRRVSAICGVSTRVQAKGVSRWRSATWTKEKRAMGSRRLYRLHQKSLPYLFSRDSAEVRDCVHVRDLVDRSYPGTLN